MDKSKLSSDSRTPTFMEILRNVRNGDAKGAPRLTIESYCLHSVFLKKFAKGIVIKGICT